FASAAPPMVSVPIARTVPNIRVKILLLMIASYLVSAESMTPRGFTAPSCVLPLLVVGRLLQDQVRVADRILSRVQGDGGHDVVVLAVSIGMPDHDESLHGADGGAGAAQQLYLSARVRVVQGEVVRLAQQAGRRGADQHRLPLVGRALGVAVAHLDLDAMSARGGARHAVGVRVVAV